VRESNVDRRRPIHLRAPLPTVSVDVTLQDEHTNKVTVLLPWNLNRAMAVERARSSRLQFSEDRLEDVRLGTDDPADRWVTCAAVILLILGLMSFLEGVAIVAHAHFGLGIHYLAGSLATRGWIALCTGAVGLVVGMCARPHSRGWRWAAGIALVLAAIAQLITIPNYPGWVLCILMLDFIAVLELIASGRSANEANRRPSSLTSSRRVPVRATAGAEQQPNEDAPERQTHQWRRWRRCAQDVTRSWNEWLAADHRRSAECYRRYVSALAAEERAAADFEHTLLEAAGKGHE